MAVTATKSTELSAATPPVTEAVASEPDAVEYPAGDWTAPSLWHGDAVGCATTALLHHFRDHDDVLVAMELVVYYERGNNRAWLQSVLGPGGVEHLPSEVLGLDLRTARRDGATVLMIRDPRTGEESDGALEEYDRRRRIAEDERDAKKSRLEATQDRLSAAEDKLSTARDELNAVKEAAKAEVSATRERASGAEERARELEQPVARKRPFWRRTERRSARTLPPR